MLRHLLKGIGLAVLLGIAAAVVVFVGGRWREAAHRGGQQPAEPFRIAGNLYYVGANDVTSFLLTGPEGHVLIDGGYRGTAPMIMASIAKLGFDIRDVRVLLNSHAHIDHAGGLAALQQASGARLWVSEGDADAVASGGAESPYVGPLGFASSLPMFRYPAARVDRRFADGATVRLGPIALTAHVTGGHTPGCTSWTFPVRDGDRELRVVHRCSLQPPPPLALSADPGIREDFERSFRTLRSLPVDIWVTSHAREFGRWRKFRERTRVADPVAPFIDREGYLRSIDSAEVRWRALLADRQRRS
jgi:metallo-beta-lactamase class B